MRRQDSYGVEMAPSRTTIDLTRSDDETRLSKSKSREVIDLGNGEVIGLGSDLGSSTDYGSPQRKVGLHWRQSSIRQADRTTTRQVPRSTGSSHGKQSKAVPLALHNNAAKGLSFSSDASYNRKRNEQFHRTKSPRIGEEIADSEEERRPPVKTWARATSEKEVQRLPSAGHRSRPRARAEVEVESDNELPTVDALFSRASSLVGAQSASGQNGKPQLRGNLHHVSERTFTKASDSVETRHTAMENGQKACLEFFRPPFNGLFLPHPPSSPSKSSSPELESPVPISLPGPPVENPQEETNSNKPLSDTASQAEVKEQVASLRLSSEPIKAWLRQFSAKQSYEISHGCMITIRNARLASRDTTAAFVSVDPPFADLDKVIQRDDGSAAKLNESVVHYTYKKKLIKSHQKVPTISVRGDTRRVPGYTHHTSLRTNILEGDDGKLKYFPQFQGLNDANEVKSKRAAEKLDQDLRDAFESIEVFSSSSSLDSENYLRDRFCLTSLLCYLGIELQVLSIYVAQQEKKELQEEYYLSSKMTEVLIDSLDIERGALASTKDHVVLASICEAWEAVFSFPLRNVVFTKDRLKDLTRSSEILHQEEPTQVIGTYTDICCVICNTIHCQTHGWYAESRSSETDEDDLDIEGHKKPKYHFRQHVVRLLEETLQSHERRISNDQSVQEGPSLDLSPCSEECYLTNGHAEEICIWTKEDQDLLKAITVSRFPRSLQNKRPCYLSFALKRPCWQVQQQINALGTTVQQPKSLVSAAVGMNWKDNRKWYDNKAKVLHDKWREWTEAHNHQARSHMELCIHSGPCQKGCPCFEANILCEANCLCSEDCQRKFTGCNCHSKGNNCVTDTCICVQMNRECGAECYPCGAVERLDPANKHNEKLFSSGCQNVMLQRAFGKRLFVGESKIKGAGYGLFIGETAKKGDFIDEYVGEDITWSEVARRGIYNGLKDTSYLFDINGDGAIDGDRLANKTRYINHADERDPARNCEARVMWVGGVHRIKFIAARPISEGEELLFDYGEEFVTKAGLDKKKPMPNSKKSRTHKILEDVAGAERALDDMAQKTGEERGHRTTTRGGHGEVSGQGRKSRKLTKTNSRTPPPWPELPVFVYEIQDDEEMDPDFVADNRVDEEEEEESDVGEEGEKEKGRNGRKRQRRLPSRYSR